MNKILKPFDKLSTLNSSTNFFPFNQSRNYTNTIKDCPYYDVIVIGGGHAGCEAAHASSRLSASTLLITHKIETIGQMSCNPSFGGIGKGHLMREIDALDGLTAKVCDMSGTNYKILNKRRGPAVWGHRAQIDRVLYKKNMQQIMLNTKNLNVISESVDDILFVDEDEANNKRLKIIGVRLENGNVINCKSVVITTGTFLRANINTGLETRPAGRLGDKPSVQLGNSLEKNRF